MKDMAPIEFQSVSRAEARLVLAGAPAAQSDWTDRRIERKEESLRPSTTEWIDGLPAELRPVNLAQKYVRIANKICHLWNEPMQCRGYLDDLMIVRRQARMGFAPAVAMEIGALNLHYNALHPAGRSWVEPVTLAARDNSALKKR